MHGTVGSADCKPESRAFFLGFVLCQILAIQAVAFEPLPRTAPESLGIDAAGVDRFLTDLEHVSGAESVVVVHRGRIVAEAYWIRSPSNLRHLRSVTKSVTSTLIGIAIDRGFIHDIDDRMVDYLPPALMPSDPAKDQILLRHLLTHTSGLQWNEGVEFGPWSTSSNPLRYILDRPLASAPGAAFNYSTAATHLLSAVLQEATGIGVEDFAETYLFSPLGITYWRWDDDPLAYPFGGHGLELRTEDMAKLGLLFLYRGRWGDRQVLSADWVRAATAVQRPGSSSWGPLQDVSYGLLWWIARAGEIDLYMALGWGGQLVICVPDLDLVVATNASWQLDGDTADAHERAILEVVVEKLIPLIPIRHRSPHRPTRRVRPAPGSGLGVNALDNGW